MSEPVQDNARHQRKTGKNPAPDSTAAEAGPAILFFSGGTALRGLSRHLLRHTRNSIHLSTPFDSGGSSASIRKAFHMPAVGDLRNRLVALADPAISGRPEIFLGTNRHSGPLTLVRQTTAPTGGRIVYETELSHDRKQDQALRHYLASIGRYLSLIHI